VPALDFDIVDEPQVPSFSRTSMRITTQPRAPAPRPTATAAPQIPTRVAEVLKRDAVAKGDSCPISMEDFTASSKVAITSCFHLFQEDALTTWLQSHTACPLCKEAVTFTVKV
jgi:hypothetical protein